MIKHLYIFRCDDVAVMASLPTVPRPVYNELYERNVTAWMISTQSRLIAEPMALQDRFLNFSQGLVTSVADWVGEYVDIDFVIFIKWLMSPIIITFCILPL